MDNTYEGNCADIAVLKNDAEDDESIVNRLPEQTKGPYREQDIYLPIANVARIMKSAVPSNGKIAKDAKECVQECVSEFISFITSEASERCAQEKRKTINGEDVLFAMGTLGFDPYIAPLKIYLQKYRDTLKAEKSVSYQESTDAAVLHDADVVDPFAPSQFSDLLDPSEQSNVFSNQHSVNLDQQQMPFS